MTITPTKAVSATATHRAAETTAKQLPITNKIGTLVCSKFDPKKYNRPLWLPSPSAVDCLQKAREN